MLAHPTLEHLHALGLHGIAKGFKELEHKPEARGLDHAEWLGLLLEYELTLRRQKQFETRARAAHLRHAAAVEDVNYQSPRGLDRALFLKLGACDWIAERRNLLITGASGLGGAEREGASVALVEALSEADAWPEALEEALAAGKWEGALRKSCGKRTAGGESDRGDALAGRRTTRRSTIRPPRRRPSRKERCSIALRRDSLL